MARRVYRKCRRDGRVHCYRCSCGSLGQPLPILLCQLAAVIAIAALREPCCETLGSALRGRRTATRVAGPSCSACVALCGTVPDPRGQPRQSGPAIQVRVLLCAWLAVRIGADRRACGSRAHTAVRASYWRHRTAFLRHGAGRRRSASTSRRRSRSSPSRCRIWAPPELHGHPGVLARTSRALLDLGSLERRCRRTCAWALLASSARQGPCRPSATRALAFALFMLIAVERRGRARPGCAVPRTRAPRYPEQAGADRPRRGSVALALKLGIHGRFGDFCRTTYKAPATAAARPLEYSARATVAPAHELADLGLLDASAGRAASFGPLAAMCGDAGRSASRRTAGGAAGADATAIGAHEHAEDCGAIGSIAVWTWASSRPRIFAMMVLWRYDDGDHGPAADLTGDWEAWCQGARAAGRGPDAPRS